MWVSVGAENALIRMSCRDPVCHSVKGGVSGGEGCMSIFCKQPYNSSWNATIEKKEALLNWTRFFFIIFFIYLFYRDLICVLILVILTFFFNLICIEQNTDSAKFESCYSFLKSSSCKEHIASCQQRWTGRETQRHSEVWPPWCSPRTTRATFLKGRWFISQVHPVKSPCTVFEKEQQTLGYWLDKQSEAERHQLRDEGSSSRGGSNQTECKKLRPTSLLAAVACYPC